jgi:hypothetical protein
MQRFESCRLELRVLAISILECRCSNPAASASQPVSNASHMKIAQKPRTKHQTRPAWGNKAPKRKEGPGVVADARAFPPVPCAEPIACTVKSASAFADFDTRSSGVAPSYPELPEQSHLADSMLHDLITAILVAIAAVIASGLLDRIWDTI